VLRNPNTNPHTNPNTNSNTYPNPNPQRHFDLSPDGSKIKLHLLRANDLIEKMRTEERKFDMVFIDADKKMYKQYLMNIMGEDDSGSNPNPNPNSSGSTGSGSTGSGSSVRDSVSDSVSDCVSDSVRDSDSVSDSDSDSNSDSNSDSDSNSRKNGSEINSSVPGRSLLLPNALIIVDNTLWKGLVLGQVKP
jgi:hypothetical protein